MSGRDAAGAGRSASRGRAVRRPTQQGGEEAPRPPSRGVVPGVGRVSPGSAARDFEDLTLQGDSDGSPNGTGNGNGNGNGNGDYGRMGGGDHAGNGNGNGMGSRRRGSPPTNGNIRGDTSVGLRGEGQRRENRLEDYDIIRSRPPGLGKQGSVGQPINLVANYFEVRRAENWCLYQHRVDFAPELDFFRARKELIRANQTTIGAYIFDGTLIYTHAPLCEPGDTRELNSTRDGQLYVIRIRLVGKLEQETPMYITFYNMVVRKCQEFLKLILMGRHYFDGDAAIKLNERRLELWPGVITVMRQHESNLLMCVEMTHKVIRQDDVMTILSQKRSQIMNNGGNMDQVKEAVRSELLGTIVMTSYNNCKTYRVDDILWNEKPTDTFPTKNGDTTYVDYYRTKYEIELKSARQPLLASKPKTRDVRRGMTEMIKLIPELCQMTGLTDAMKSDFRLMKDVNQILFAPPKTKLEDTVKLVGRIRNSTEAKAELTSWGLNILGAPVSVPGRVLPNEKIVFSDGRGQKLIETDNKADWTMAFRGSKMVTNVDLKNWIIIIPQRDFQGLENLTRTIQRVATPLGFNLQNPFETVRIQYPSPDGYSQAITEMMNKHGSKIQMFFVILPNNRIEAYSAIKVRCNVEYGVPSQCFLAKHLNNPKGLMSICTKVAIQMNAKLGGEPWHIAIPLKKLMIVGFDVHHGGAKTGGGQSKSVAAMVCTTSASYGRYYSTLSFHENRDEVSTKISSDVRKCLLAWRKINNGELPDRIIFYRDGVGEGQLNQVYTVELEAIKRCLHETYGEAGLDDGKLTYVVVTKRVNARFFHRAGGGFDNPPPGTVVDNVVTWPERWDFYLIAQIARQGTVGPTSYNVLYEKNGLDADKIQRLTFKLCHAYYNWSGTVSVPAPCQYAHKLAYLVGLATKQPTHQELSHLLYFL